MDVYSFGVLLSEALTGQLAFDRSKKVKLLSRRLEKSKKDNVELEDPSADWPRDAADALATLALQCFRTSDAEYSGELPRPAMAEVLTELRRVRADLVPGLGLAPSVMGAASDPEAPGRIPSDLGALRSKVAALLSRIKREKERAGNERLSLVVEQKSLSKPLPPVPKDQKPVIDLEVLDPTSAEACSVARHAQHPVACTVKVNVPTRAARFDKYVKALPPANSGTVTVLHGTNPGASANAIARNGPDVTIMKNGKAYGQGFYTAVGPGTPANYAGPNGAVCVLTAAPGRMLDASSGLTGPHLTAHSLASFNPPLDSVSVSQAGWHVFFHPDAVRVDYILHHSQTELVSEATRLKEEAYKKAVAEHAVKETTRKFELRKRRKEEGMVDYFVRMCDVYADGLSTDNALVRERLFLHEAVQFSQKMMMYSGKERFLKLMAAHQVLIIQGGTGVGKTALVPQWTYDALMCNKDAPVLSERAVAVLVPRKAIALSLAEFVSKIRRTQVGEEVGVGTGDEYKVKALSSAQPMADYRMNED